MPFLLLGPLQAGAVCAVTLVVTVCAGLYGTSIIGGVMGDYLVGAVLRGMGGCAGAFHLGSTSTQVHHAHLPPPLGSLRNNP